MSTWAPNYCGSHNVRYVHHCHGCLKDWLESLPPVERALADYRGNRTPTHVKRLIEDFRRMDCA